MVNISLSNLIDGTTISSLGTQANCSDLDIDIRREEVFSLEQDEQRVPGEDSSPDSEFNLEMSNPVDDKNQTNIIVHTIAPDTVELAYDSDPMDIEE
jgi:hypothetical protein